MTDGYRDTLSDLIRHNAMDARLAAEWERRAQDARDRAQRPEEWEMIDDEPELVAAFGARFRREGQEG